jgi:hypothetical protein
MGNRNDGETKRPSSENGMILDRSPSFNSSSRKANNKNNINSIQIATLESEREKVNEKHLKIIEDQMIQSKQAERALKRREGDVKKEQRQVRQAVREFDTSKCV